MVWILINKMVRNRWKNILNISTDARIQSINPFSWLKPLSCVSYCNHPFTKHLDFFSKCVQHAIFQRSHFSPCRIAYYRILVHPYHYPLQNIVNHQTGAISAPGPQSLVLALVDAVGDCTYYRSWNWWRWHGEIDIMFWIFFYLSRQWLVHIWCCGTDNND